MLSSAMSTFAAAMARRESPVVRWVRRAVIAVACVYMVSFSWSIYRRLRQILRIEQADRCHYAGAPSLRGSQPGPALIRVTGFGGQKLLHTPAPRRRELRVQLRPGQVSCSDVPLGWRQLDDHEHVAVQVRHLREARAVGRLQFTHDRGTR